MLRNFWLKALVCIIPVILQGQNKGYVEYKKEAIKAQDSIVRTEGELAYLSVVQKASTSLSSKLSILEIDNTKSFYKTEENLVSDSQDAIYATLANSLYETDRTYYFESSSENLYISLDSFGENLIVKQNTIPYKWNILNERKTILGFSCFKATSTKTIKNNKGEFKFPVTVWFSSDLPFRTGPEDFVGLPGIVLEASLYSSVPFTIKAIQIKEDNSIRNIQPQKGSQVSLEEYEEIQANQGKNFKNYIKN